MIKLTGVTKSFGTLDVLNGVDLELQRGDSMVLISLGSGKSLLLEIHDRIGAAGRRDR